jgi:transcriptional/translational regulatory protein YebC/TACO1
MSEITDFDIALKIIKMLEAFDEDEDVQDVFINADIDDELQAKVLDFIEKNTFKT